jgi:glycosyltransferase involved in cell wall biosynthesis
MQPSKKIVIGVDIRDLKVSKTGQRTVIEELYKQFSEINDDRFKFVFFTSPLPVYTGKVKLLLITEHIRYQFWKQVVLPFKAWLNNCDILFCGDYFTPLIQPGFKSIEIFHDAFFFEYPEHYNRLWLKLFHHIAVPAARKSAFLMIPTKYASQQIHTHTGIPKDKLVVIYPGPKSAVKQWVAKQTSPKISRISNRKYILHVGVYEKRKNIPALIEAFKRLRDSGHRDFLLVLAGSGNGKRFSDDTKQITETIRRHALEQHVIQLGYLPDEDLGTVYRNAFMYVFPSFNEGFGIPILEAFECNLPVLVANNTCLPEVGADAVVTFNPYDTDDMVNKMKLVIENESLRHDLILKGKKRLQEFSWETTTQKLLNLFEKAYHE